MRGQTSLRRLLARWLIAGSFVTLALPLLHTSAAAQIDMLRRAREKVSTSLPNLSGVFAAEAPLTTSLDDADEVPALDGYEPAQFSPMAEMPRGTRGSFHLVPGAYFFEAESYCLRAGTYGPRTGDGYVHAPLKGPKADIITRILERSYDHPEIEQYSIQTLLWAITARAKLSEMPRDMQLVAAKLLTPTELLELNGYALDAVSNSVKEQALRNAPAALRQVLEAENRLRQMMSAADTRFESLERVAVLTGVVPDDGSRTIPVGRWSYHPSGYFIRYKPSSYRQLRIEIYYPESLEIRRDERGRIISVAARDGRRLETEYGRPGEPRFASLSLPLDLDVIRGIRFTGAVLPEGAAAAPSAVWAPLSEVAVPRSGWLETTAPRDGNASTQRQTRLSLARADLLDLLHFERALRASLLGAAPGDAAAQSQALIREAVHTALARYHAAAAHGEVEGARLRATPHRVAWSSEGYRYVIAPGSNGEDAGEADELGRRRLLQGFGPSGGGAVGSGPRQRLGPSPRPNRGPDDPLEQARRFTGAVGNLADAASVGDGLRAAGWRGALGNFAAGLIPNVIFNAGLNAVFNKAGEIDDALNGRPSGRGGGSFLRGPATHYAVGPEHRQGGESARVQLASWSQSPLGEETSIHGQDATPTGNDYRTLSRPREVRFERVAPSAEVSAAQAEAIDALIEATLRLGASLEAAWLAQQRYGLAHRAGDAVWEERQARAMVYLRRDAGNWMVQFADRSDALLAMAGGQTSTWHFTADDVRTAQQILRTRGWSAEYVAASRSLGQSDSDRERRRQELLSLDPQKAAGGLATHLKWTAVAMRDYGTYWGSLPPVAPPWQ